MSDKKTVKEVLRGWDNQPKGKPVPLSGLGYLLEQDDTPDDQTGDADPEDFDDVTVAPQFLSDKGAGRIMNIYRNHRLALHDVVETPRLRYEYRDKEIIFQCHNYDEGLELTIRDSDTGEAFSDYMPLDWQGGRVMAFIDNAIDGMDTGADASNAVDGGDKDATDTNEARYSMDDVRFHIQDLASDFMWIGHKGDEIQRMLSNPKNLAQIKIRMKQCLQQAERLVKEIPKVMGKM